MYEPEFNFWLGFLGEIQIMILQYFLFCMEIEMIIIETSK